ncbi:hypothetical protein BXZ70DRAFT_421476 [Cristinia sonorae]|uniref:BOD1/SHG1 domain-containing protein n=1 Tax=Cristinia sonorae TaxID=1940300 RepID=A0A8K0UXD8_9AGAR|nr:hypothetical protein BXZ70DRAFT_421476 [Cristinia sonorae]
MPAQTPAQLVDEFKKSGEFDRLRRDLLNSFRNGGGMNTLVTRVEELTKNKLSSEPQLQHMAEAQTVRELMQELERYPLIERAVADVPALVDPSFAASLRRSIEIVLYDDQRDGKLSNRVSSGAAAGALGTALTERTQIGHLLQVQKDPVAENGDSNI